MIAGVKALVVGVLLLCSLAHADNKKRPAPVLITGRVVDLEVTGDSRIVTVMTGSEKGVGKKMRATFRETATGKPLPGGDAVVIRVDHWTTVLKTSLTPEQIRANRVVQFGP